MSRCRVLSVLGVSVVLGALSLAFIPLPQVSKAKPASAPATAGDDASGTYNVDPVHSSVVFRVKHMGVSWFYGRFNEVSGAFTYDGAHPEKSSVDLVIPVASVDSNNAKRDQHLKSPDFFSADEFPDMGFKSDKVKQLKPGVLEVTGKLSMHGESKPITVQVELAGSSTGGEGRPSAAGFETTFTIKRSDFGMKQYLEMLGDEVRVTVSVEAGKAR